MPEPAHMPVFRRTLAERASRAKDFFRRRFISEDRVKDRATRMLLVLNLQVESLFADKVEYHPRGHWYATRRAGKPFGTDYAPAFTFDQSAPAPDGSASQLQALIEAMVADGRIANGGPQLIAAAHYRLDEAGADAHFAFVDWAEFQNFLENIRIRYELDQDLHQFGNAFQTQFIGHARMFSDNFTLTGSQAYREKEEALGNWNNSRLAFRDACTSFALERQPTKAYAESLLDSWQELQMATLKYLGKYMVMVNDNFGVLLDQIDRESSWQRIAGFFAGIGRAAADCWTDARRVARDVYDDCLKPENTPDPWERRYRGIGKQLYAAKKFGKQLFKKFVLEGVGRRKQLLDIYTLADELHKKWSEVAIEPFLFGKRDPQAIIDDRDQLLPFINAGRILSKMWATRPPVVVARVNLVKTIQFAINQYGNTTDAVGTVYAPGNTDRLPSGKVDVLADPGIISEIVVNLIKNSVEQGKRREQSDHVHVTFWLEQTQDGVKLHVLDNCGGFLAEHEAKIFKQRFTTKGTNGNGIGLTWSKEKLLEMDSDIEIVNHAGTGAEFILTLPKAGPLGQTFSF